MQKFKLDKTLVFNVLALVLVIASGFGFSDFEPMPEISVIGAAIVAVINLISREFLHRSVQSGRYQ